VAREGGELGKCGGVRAGEARREERVAGVQGTRASHGPGGVVARGVRGEERAGGAAEERS